MVPDSLSGRDLSKNPAQNRETVGDGPVVHPSSPFLPFNQAGLEQHLEVVAHRWLRNPDRFDQIAGGARFTHGGDDAEQPQSSGIAENTEPFSQLSSLGAIERFGRQWCTALDYGFHGAMIPHIDAHRYDGSVG